LLVFAWLRECLPIEYGGLSDRLLLQCGVELNDNLTLELKESETAALPLVAECLGDLTSHLGPWCRGLLASGRKIEMEALFSFAAGMASCAEQKSATGPTSNETSVSLSDPTSALSHLDFRVRTVPNSCVSGGLTEQG
jgi:hypothetical protein